MIQVVVGFRYFKLVTTYNCKSGFKVKVDSFFIANPGK